MDYLAVLHSTPFYMAERIQVSNQEKKKTGNANAYRCKRKKLQAPPPKTKRLEKNKSPPYYPLTHLHQE